MKELNKEQKERLVEALKKIKPELSDEEINAKIEAKLKNKPTALRDEELSNISGGGAIQPYEDVFNWFIDFYTGFGEWVWDGGKDIYNYFFPEVQGPKTGLVKCSICGQLVHHNAMKDHIIEKHAGELIKYAEKF